MNRRTLIAASIALAMLPAKLALADDVTSGNLTISGAFARASPMMAQAGAGFMKIANSGEADRLVAPRSSSCSPRWQRSRAASS